MNRTVYFLTKNTVTPINQQQKGVYQHHTDAIEELAILMDAVPKATSLVLIKGGYVAHPASDAVRMVATGEVSLAVFWSEQHDENFGPTGYYIVLEA